MTRLPRPHCRAATALAACMLPLLPGATIAQTSSVAIEVSPSHDSYLPTRVAAHVIGQVSDPAAAYVRGCQGNLLPESAGVVFEVTEHMASLAFTGAGAGLVSLVLGTPDGLYQCALGDDQGHAVVQLADADAGRYTVWMGAVEGGTIDARLFASELPVSSLELFGLDVAALGPPRAGRHEFTATAESGRQQLALGATLHAETEMIPLSAEYCPGFSRFDAADAVLALEQPIDLFSIFALSERDLTMAVVAPDGAVTCNDDAYQLNPAVTLEHAQAGDYQVFVGGYSPGGTDSFDLFASVGAPAFMDDMVDLSATPRAGAGVLDPVAAGQGQLLANADVSANDPMEGLPIGAYCPGFTDVTAPDFVLTLEAAQPMLSLYARAQTDLVMAVRAPDGGWVCNDDAFRLNPAVGFENAPPGDYLIYVGVYDPGMQGSYNLYAALGSPNWTATRAEGAMPPTPLDTAATPMLGRIEFGPHTGIDPRIIFDIQPSRTEAFGMGPDCAGFITPQAPDLVITALPELPQLMVYMASEADGTLVIAGPDGRVYCNDDFENLNPGVMIPNAPAGDYAVFAGTYDGGGGLATLGVTIASPQWVMDRVH